MITTNTKSAKELHIEYEQNCKALREGKMWSWAPGHEWAYRSKEEITALTDNEQS